MIVDALADSALEPLYREIRNELTKQGRPRPVLLVGGVGAGKTASGLRLVSLLRQADIPVGGILAPRRLQGEETTGYSLIDLLSNVTHAFAGLEPSEHPVGRFFVSQEALDTAQRAIDHAIDEGAVVFIDEIGRWELSGGGHAASVRKALASSSLPILLVRDELVDLVVRTFGVENPIVFRVTSTDDAQFVRPAGQQTFWEIVDSIPYPILVTVCADGFPESRPMHLVEREGWTLWFATSKASRKVGQIEASPKVTVLFVDTVRYNYASIHGVATVVDDHEREEALWRNEWEDDWPDGPADPDYVLLRVDGRRGHYLRGHTGETGRIELSS